MVQPHRFDILEDIGCYPVVYNTLLAYPLVFMWPIVLGLVSFCYSGKCDVIVIFLPLLINFPSTNIEIFLHSTTTVQLPPDLTLRDEPQPLSPAHAPLHNGHLSHPSTRGLLSIHLK